MPCMPEPAVERAAANSAKACADLRHGATAGTICYPWQHHHLQPQEEGDPRLGAVCPAAVHLHLGFGEAFSTRLTELALRRVRGGCVSDYQRMGSRGEISLGSHAAS
ncbi:unnamed protein product [Arctogadus glacialis]